MKKADLTIPLLLCISSLHTLAQQTPARTTIPLRYASENIAEGTWRKDIFSIQNEFDFSNTDTVYIYYPASPIDVFVRVQTDKFDDEPKRILDFNLLGVYRNNIQLDGLYTLMYVNGSKGLLRKVYYKPGKLAFCVYDSPHKNNPFKNFIWPQSQNDTATVNGKL